jgi:hypothetical protein
MMTEATENIEDKNIKKVIRRTKNEIYSIDQDILIAKLFYALKPWIYNDLMIKASDLNENQELKEVLIQFIPSFLKYYNYSHATLIKRYLKEKSDANFTRFSCAIIKEIVKPKGIKFYSLRSNSFGTYQTFDMKGYKIKDLIDYTI